MCLCSASPSPPETPCTPVEHPVCTARVLARGPTALGGKSQTAAVAAASVTSAGLQVAAP